MTTTQDNSAPGGLGSEPTRSGGASARPPARRSGGSEPAWLGGVLTGVGVFLLVAGLLAQVYLPGQVKRAPLDTDTTSVLDGTALLPANFSDPGNLEQAPVEVFRRFKADKKASDGDVVVYDSSSCLVRDEDGISGCVKSTDPAGRLVTVGLDHFATDRKTGESVNDAKYVGDDATPHEGLVNKFPFDVEKKDYQIYDGVIQGPVKATYAGTDNVDGLDVYKFTTDASSDDAEILPEIQGSYMDQSTYYVEPKTGTIVNRVIHQERFIGGKDLVLQLDVQLTDKSRKERVDEAKSDVSSLRTATVTLPIIAYVLGALLLAAGLFLSLRRQRRTT